LAWGPVTSVPRTIVDLSSVLPAEDLARACHEAGFGSTPIPWMSKRSWRGGREAQVRRICVGFCEVM